MRTTLKYDFLSFIDAKSMMNTCAYWYRWQFFMTIIMIISMMTMLPRVWWIFVHIAALQWESEQSMKRDCASGHMYDDIWAWGWWWWWWWSYIWWHMTMMMMFSDQRIRFGERFIKKPTKVLAREGFRSFRCCRNMIFANDPILFVMIYSLILFVMIYTLYFFFYTFIWFFKKVITFLIEEIHWRPEWWECFSSVQEIIKLWF